MNIRALCVMWWSVLMVCLAAVSTAAAGDLDPPPGPIGPTMKTLVEVEPRIAINAQNTPGDGNSVFRIAQSGSYYLTGDVVGLPGHHGIEIGADNVTLDLGGFTLLGVVGSLEGISTDFGSRANIRVRNGAVRDWGDSGVGLPFGSNAQVSDLVVSGSGGIGIWCGSSATVESCIVSGGGAQGIYCIGNHSSVRFCKANQNSGDGIRTNNNGTVTDCTAYQNGGRGILTGSSSLVLNCMANANSNDGVNVGLGSTVTSCTCVNNGNNGILALTRCTVSSCTCVNNQGSGIQVPNDSFVLSNTCAANGMDTNIEPGILVTGADNRIEGNNCVDNRIGIRVIGGGNIIVRNTCSGNSFANWEIIAGNVCLVVQAVAAGAISGNSGGTSPGSTDPNANFSY